MFLWTQTRYDVLRTLDPDTGRSLSEITRELGRRAKWFGPPRFIVWLHLRHLLRYRFAREDMGMGLKRLYRFVQWWAPGAQAGE